MSSKHITDDDDLDDLDDIVDQFEVSSSKRPDSSETSDKPTASNNTQSVKGSSPPPDSLPEDLAKQLAEGIDALLRDFNGGASGSSEDRKRQEDWEKMLVDGLNGTDDADFLGLGGSKQKSQTNLSASSGSQQQPTGDFQANVLQALEKLKDSDSTLLTESSAAETSGDPLESILKQLTSGLDDSDGDNDELQTILETMMQQLMSKEILYEPLKELYDKFPGYLTEHSASLSMEDKERYNNQLECVTEVITIFDDPSYKDEDADKKARIVTLMNKMQSFGSPPPEVMGPLPTGGLDFNPDGSPKLPEGCTIT
ncbi:Pex19-domain-containing [Pyrrhoderma noxium]|uniref:Pex19-domain-containing n=1 Tax=Pyrrhoderma noxium TaxID=2282107 RepID=A0A286UDP6_9AGAM|nr:Pex19-domain-containing [Pyrrhoderma noxium]